MQNNGQNRLLVANALFMGAMFLAALWLERWAISFVSLATLGLCLVPVLVAKRLSITLPGAFLAATTLFVFGSIFLGEAFDFYERLWWWDLALHGSSAVGFGLIGFLFIFTLFDGDRFAAPPIALSFLSFSLAVAIGTLWEVFEFAMDLAFGMNMQKSGLDDTMLDIIINMIGSAFAGLSGYFYLKGRGRWGLSPLIDNFIKINRDFYRKSRARFRK